MYMFASWYRSFSNANKRSVSIKLWDKQNNLNILVTMNLRGANLMSHLARSPSHDLNSMKPVIPLHCISWKKTPNDAVTPQHQSQFTPKMKANRVSCLLSSLVWIDWYHECNGMTSFMEFMLRVWCLPATTCSTRHCCWLVSCWKPTNIKLPWDIGALFLRE